MCVYVFACASHRVVVLQTQDWHEISIIGIELSQYEWIYEQKFEFPNVLQAVGQVSCTRENRQEKNQCFLKHNCAYRVVNCLLDKSIVI